MRRKIIILSNWHFLHFYWYLPIYKKKYKSIYHCWASIQLIPKRVTIIMGHIHAVYHLPTIMVFYYNDFYLTILNKKLL